MIAASPVQRRQALAAAQALSNAGIHFVCIPVVDGEKDYQALVKMAQDRLEAMAVAAEEAGKGE